MDEDPAVLEILDDYLAQLHAGQRPDRESLLRKHPELASSIECIEALEGMAPSEADLDALPAWDDTLDHVSSLPRTFGQYELLSELGRGGMGVVYKARQNALDRTVAVKMILASHLASSEHIRRFQIEARAAARLRHSNIVPIHEVGQCNGQHFFAMDFIDGESLAQRNVREPLSLEEAARMTSVVARAVEHLHGEAIVHRDLKPSNILLDREGTPYITDFGLAKVFEAGSDATTTGMIIGTPSYMAPEQAAGHNSEVGPAADIYSLGAILYELITGEPPFRRENPLDTVLDILGSEPTSPRKLNPQIPPGLELICLKCLAKSPADRYRTANDLADDLDRFARAEPLAVRPPHLGQRFVQWSRREPALSSRLGALGLYYVIATLNYLFGVADASFERKTTFILVIWAVASVFFQQFLPNPRWSDLARFVWGTLDSILLLAMVLLVGDGTASGMLAAYPLVIVASGLWFRERYVWFMTALSLISYGIVVIDFYVWRPRLQINFDPGPTRHILFAASLFVMGWSIAYLVRRLRKMSSFFGRQLP